MKVRNVGHYPVQVPLVSNWLVMPGEVLEVSSEVGRALCSQTTWKKVVSSPKKKVTN